MNKNTKGFFRLHSVNNKMGYYISDRQENFLWTLFLSRLLGFFPSEKTESLSTVFKEALLRRGIPKIVYVDNGKVFRSDVFQVACATLGIVLTHTQPYDAVPVPPDSKCHHASLQGPEITPGVYSGRDANG